MKPPLITAPQLRSRYEYDPETGLFTDKTGARGYSKGRTAGFVGQRGYVGMFVNGRAYYAHRLAWLHFFGQWPEGEIDHINGDRGDNRIANLRDVTRHENAKNKPLDRRNKSGANGVVETKSGRWSAYIHSMRKKKWLGTFDTFEEAERARISANAQYGFHENHGRIV